jgi:hypothetical protein
MKLALRVIHIVPASHGMVGLILRLERGRATEEYPVGVYSALLPLPAEYQPRACACHGDMHYPTVPNNFWDVYEDEVIAVQASLLNPILLPYAEKLPSWNQVTSTPFEA